MKISSFYIRIAILFISVFSVGCVVSSHGTKIDQTNVSQIKKGVTTRAEVETLLGPPAHVGMINDGKRMLMYNFTETSLTGMSPTNFIPLVGPYVGQSTSQLRRQSLTIIVDKSGVVEDYEYSDNAQATERGMFFSQKSTSIPISAAQ